LPTTIVAQAMLPVLDRREMRGEPGDRDVLGNVNELAAIADNDANGVWNAIMRRLEAIPGYVALFSAAFPNRTTGQLGFDDAARAIAAFQMQAFTRTNSPFDRFLARDDAALTAEQKRGANLFFGEARCASCHGGPFLGAQSFANVGVPQIGPGSAARPPLDIGRAGIENQPFYRFAFRVAPLRNVELTAPYMHDGAYPTLEAVLRHYDDVRTAAASYDVSQLDPALRGLVHTDAATVSEVLANVDGRLQVPLDLTDAEQREIIAFLKSLTDPSARDLQSLVPASVPSGLPLR
jgi:cytochrome c peroxidase